MSKTIAIVASLDSKSREVAYARDFVQRAGHKALVIDLSVRHKPSLTPDVSSSEVLAAIGVSWEEIQKNDKSKRIELMAQAITAKLSALYEAGKFDGVFSMGGLQNTTMATLGMQALPWGVPKVMLTTIASGNRTFGPYVGTRDVMIMHSVGDISGINFLTESVIGNALAAVIGMAEKSRGRLAKQDKNKTAIGATMMGITGDGVVEAIRVLEDHGHDVITFHTNGIGGRSMEEMIGMGMLNAVLDMTIYEVTGELLGGFAVGAPGRLTAAAKAGIPQVIAPGSLDVVTWATEKPGVVPPTCVDRKYQFFHNSTLVHNKVTQPEMVRIAEIIADRLNMGRGPVTFLVPLGGFNNQGGPGGKLFDRAIDETLVAILRQKCDKRVRIIETEYNINDAAFGQMAANLLLEYLA